MCKFFLTLLYDSYYCETLYISRLDSDESRNGLKTLNQNGERSWVKTSPKSLENAVRINRDSYCCRTFYMTSLSLEKDRYRRDGWKSRHSIMGEDGTVKFQPTTPKLWLFCSCSVPVISSVTKLSTVLIQSQKKAKTRLP